MMFLSRRGFVGGTVAITLAANATEPAIGETAHDLAAPENLLRVYRAMRGGIGDEPALWWLTGTVYAKVLGKTNVPLVQVHGASWNRLTDGADGNLDQAMDEAGYFGDVDSGELLETLWS